MEIYQYKFKDKLITFDVNTTTFFALDLVSTKWLMFKNKGLSVDEIKKNLKKSHSSKKRAFSKRNMKRLKEMGFFINSNLKFKKVEGEFRSYELKLHPNSRCNLKCKYCFEEEFEYKELDRNLSFEVAKKSIDFMVENFAKASEQIIIDLTGSGEPILNIEIIKQIADYCKELEIKTNKYILVQLCTNGTLLTKEIANFLKENRILYGISLDGTKASHDSNRIYSNGKGTYEDIVKNLALIEEKEYIGFASTLNGNNTNVKEIFKNLYSLNVADSISIKPIRNFGSETYAINSENINEIKENYAIFMEFLLDLVLKNEYEELDTVLRGVDYFGKFLKRVLWRRKGINRCSAGLDSLSIDYKGDIYICPVELNNENFKIGDIYNGIDINKREKLREYTVDNIETCKSCWARYLCGGECLSVGDKTSGILEKPYEIMCQYKKYLIGLSGYFWLNVAENNPSALDYFIKKYT